MESVVKTWQYYYFLIRDPNGGVKMMDSHLWKYLPPEVYLEVLSRPSNQQNLRRPSLTLC